MTSPTISPIVATPQAQLKRKRESVDLTEAALRQHVAGHVVEAAPPVKDGNEERRLEDDEFSDDEEGSMFEDALDEIELNPFVPGMYRRQTCGAPRRLPPAD